MAYANPFSSQSTSGNPFDFGNILSNFIYRDRGETSKSTNPNGIDGYDYDEDDKENVYDWKKSYETLMDDFDSYRKRVENARRTEKRNLTKEIINGFLDVVEYTLFTYKAKNSVGTYTKEDEMILNKLSDFLKTYDVHPMKDPVGSAFDHNLHEAVMTDNSGMFNEGTVTMVISHGYMIGDEVLRYAKVVVAV